MSKKVADIAKKYYPNLWDEKRIANLLRTKLISKKEYDEIIKGYRTK